MNATSLEHVLISCSLVYNLEENSDYSNMVFWRIEPGLNVNGDVIQEVLQQKKNRWNV